MFVARFAYIAALTVWLGGMVVLGAIAAPATFQVLEARDGGGGRAAAGEVFGEVLRMFHLLSYAAAAVMLVSLLAMAMLGPRPHPFKPRVLLVAGMLAIALYSGIPLTRQIQRVQAQIGVPVSQLAAEDPRRATFGRLHGVSTGLMLVNILGGLALLFFEARE
jgi:uncharacterized membrane protein